MKIYTIQPVSIYNQLICEGIFHSQPLLDPDSNSFLAASEDFKIPLAYGWICEKMMTKGMKRPGNDIFPTWAYVHWWGSKHSKPDLRSSQIRSWAKDSRMVLMTLEVPAEELLVFDYGFWIYCLSYSYIGTVKESEQFDRLCRKSGLSLWRDEPFPEPFHDELLNSWEMVFDLEKSRKLRRLKKDNHDIQATFWSLRKEYVVSAVEFGNGRRLVRIAGKDTRQAVTLNEEL